MTPAERHERLGRLFEQARGRPPGERAAWLRGECADDPSLVDEVLALLEHDETSVSGAPTMAAKSPAHAGSAEQTIDASEGVRHLSRQDAPTRIGRYTLKQKLGEGGMGVVYLAQREGEGTTVSLALKIMRSTVASSEERERFERERRLLGALDHPNIARLLDMGTSDDGHPYFVMEYVRGVPIDRYCDENRLSTEERLTLFRKVCDAVHYVHQNLIIHRDIKPGNILVTPEGEPKLLDFGISKLINQAYSPSVDVTRPGFRLMTPRYASPEQIRDLPITTTTDVYSLGVLLYELLTGHWPYAIKTTQVREIERAICDLEPERPSTAIARTEGLAPSGKTQPVNPSDVARVREGLPGRLRSRLRGDLDNVLLKALDKAPKRRYQSAAEFAEDLRRHAANETVLARSPSLKYRAGKFVRRNRLIVAFGLLLFFTLTAGVVGTADGWRRAEAARQRAETSEARALEQAIAAETARQQTSDLAASLVGEFQSKIVRLPGTAPVRTEMARFAVNSFEKLLEASPDDRSLKLRLASALVEEGQSLADTRSPSGGDVEGALKLQQRALELRKAAFSSAPDDRQLRADVATSTLRIADLHRAAGALGLALPLYEEAARTLEPLASAEVPSQGVRTVLAAALAGAAECRESIGEIPAAAELVARAQELRRAELASHPSPRSRRNLAVGALDLSRLAAARGDFDSALDAAEQAVAIRRELAREAPQEAEPRRDLARALLAVARVYANLKQSNAARAAALEADELLTKLLRDERLGAVGDADPADVRTRLAWIRAQVRITDVETLEDHTASHVDRLRAATDEARNLLADSPGVLEHRRALVEALTAFGRSLSATGDHDGARRTLADADEESTRVVGIADATPVDRLAQARARHAAGDAEARAAKDERLPERTRDEARDSARGWLERARTAYESLPQGPDRDAGIAAVSAALQSTGPEQRK